MGADAIIQSKVGENRSAGFDSRCVHQRPDRDSGVGGSSEQIHRAQATRSPMSQWGSRIAGLRCTCTAEIGVRLPGAPLRVHRPTGRTLRSHRRNSDSTSDGSTGRSGRIRPLRRTPSARRRHDMALSHLGRCVRLKPGCKSVRIRPGPPLSSSRRTPSSRLRTAMSEFDSRRGGQTMPRDATGSQSDCLSDETGSTPVRGARVTEDFDAPACCREAVHRRRM